MESSINQWEKAIKVIIADSGLIASLNINPEEEITDPLTPDFLKQFLEQNEIIFGIDQEVLADICSKTEMYSGKTTVIARGIEPVNGDNAYIKWTVTYDKEQKPKELQNGKVDFYSLNQIINIRKGELLAEKIHPTEGKAGKSVKGREIAAKKGKDLTIKVGKNVVLNDEKDKIYAAIDGQLVFTEKEKINVFPIYEVNGDVDFSIGNIDFVGSVVIRGNVPDGFKVHAAGDIKVYGNVEGAELIAGGDVYIAQGLLGQNKSFLKAAKNFQASFILNGNILVGESVLVSQSIMHSTVSAGKEVVCKGLKGIIVGGKIQAGERVIASVIGNDMATGTIIEVGINPQLRKELNDNQKKQKDFFESLDKVSKGINLLERMQQNDGNLPVDKKKLLVELINQKMILEKEVKSLKASEKELEEQLNKSEDANIQVLKKIFPGVKLVIGKVVKYINNETKYIKYVLDDGEVVAKNLSDKELKK